MAQPIPTTAEPLRQQGPVTRAIAAMGREPEPARRGTLRTLAALPLAAAALAGPAAAFSSPDATLIRASDAACRLWAESDTRAKAEDWDDARLDVNTNAIFARTNEAAAIQATTPAGLRAKAQLLARHFAPDFPGQEPDFAERLLDSLLRDLIGQRARA